MTDAAALAALGAALAEEMRARAPFRDPGENALPDIEAAYAAQTAAVAAMAPGAGGIGGRKIAWNTQAQMDGFGIVEPGAAVVLRGLMRQSPAVLNVADYATFAFEPEIAAVLGAPLAPREGGHDRASVLPAVARLHPAFELLDQRGFSGGRAAAAIAANVFNAGLVLGGPGLPPSEADPAALHSVVMQDGERLVDATGAAPMHPLDAVAFLANRFNRLGVTLEAGEVLLLGAHLPPRRVPGPAKLEFSLGAMGSVSCELV